MLSPACTRLGHDVEECTYRIMSREQNKERSGNRGTWFHKPDPSLCYMGGGGRGRMQVVGNVGPISGSRKSSSEISKSIPGRLLQNVRANISEHTGFCQTWTSEKGVSFAKQHNRKCLRQACLAVNSARGHQYIFK